VGGLFIFFLHMSGYGMTKRQSDKVENDLNTWVRVWGKIGGENNKYEDK